MERTRVIEAVDLEDSQRAEVYIPWASDDDRDASSTDAEGVSITDSAGVSGSMSEFGSSNDSRPSESSPTTDDSDTSSEEQCS